jgi:predicted PurR-regulated permease PerM
MPSPPARRRVRPDPADRARTAFLFLALALMIGWLLVKLKFIFLPLLLALFGAFLLSPPVEGLRRLGVPRPLAILLALAGAAGLLWLGSRYLMDSFLAFRDGFPKYEDGLAVLIGQARDLTEHFPFLTVERLRSALSGISLARLVGETLNSFFTILGYLLTALVFLLYFLAAYPAIPGRLRRAFPDQRGPFMCRAFEGIGRQVQSYILAKTASSLLTGLSVTLICLFFGLDFAVTWGVFGAALNFVPNIGAFLTVLPPAAVALVQPELGDLSSVLGLAASLTLAQVLIGNFLEPLILERNVNLSPTASLLALFLWGWLWGAVGLIVAVPAMVMVKFTCDNIDSLRPIGVLLGSRADQG